jgi:hypothetical protein
VTPEARDRRRALAEAFQRKAEQYRGARAEPAIAVLEVDVTAC